MIEIKMIDDITVRNAVANDMSLVFDAVKDAFETVIKNQACHPIKTKIFRPSLNPLLDDWIFAMPAYLIGTENIAGIKWASRCPGASAGQCHILLILNETVSNKPIAIIDGMYISLLRTFAITKLSIDILNLKPETVSIIGMGNLGKMHAVKLKELYPSIKKIKCFSYNAKYTYLVDEKIIECDNIQQALDSTEIVVTCGQKHPPYITKDMISIETKLLVNLSLFDFDKTTFEKSDVILVDDINAVKVSSTPLGELIRNEEINENKIKLIGEYLTYNIPIQKVTNFVLVNTLGMVAQDLVLANRILKRLETHQTTDKFDII